MDHLHNELKKEFQLERMILFSDAVFAIAITLLVIEIKVPEIHEEITDEAILQGLAHLIPKFVGFVISFLLIGLNWTIHHRMFGYVTAYNRRLLWLNLFFLFFIVLMPFSTGLYGEFAGPALVRHQLKVPMTFYVLNFCGAGIMNYWLWTYISNPKHKLTDPPIPFLILKQAKARALIVPIVFFLMLPTAYLIDVRLAVYVPLLMPIAMKIAAKRISKKYSSLAAKPAESQVAAD